MFISDTDDPHINSAFMKAGEKLRSSLKECGLENNEFGRLMGLPNDDKLGPNVQNWIKRGIPAKHAFKAGRILGKDPEWLCFDDEDLPDNYHPREVAEAEAATRLYETLTERQRELVSNIVREFAGR